MTKAKVPPTLGRGQVFAVSTNGAHLVADVVETVGEIITLKFLDEPKNVDVLAIDTATNWVLLAL
jgi:hypothetical protein